jgi:glucosamine--fructose-6-phosphate aminotransferase (isomerizing)
MTIAGFIREQPAALDRSVQAARAFTATWAPGHFDGIALVGSGSSFNALQVARPRFVAARRGPVGVHEPEDFSAELADYTTRPLVIVLSQSGASARTIDAAKAAIAAGLPTLAITAATESPLAACAATVLHLPVGDEPVGPKTKGFTGSMAMLFVVAESLGAPASEAMTGERLASLVEPAAAAARDLVLALADVDVIVIAGRRAHHGVALEASLKIAEMSGVPTAAFPTEELLHGRLHGLTPRSVAFVIADGSAELAEAEVARAAMARRGCRVVVVDAGGARAFAGMALPPTPWNAIGLMLPFQWLAVQLAEARGLDPEVMRHGSLSRELAIKVNAEP